MNRRRTRLIVFPLAAVLLAALATLAVVCRTRTLSEEECGPLYRHYAHCEGVRASYLKGKRVNDTMRVDMTLLQATDSAGWARLQEDFQIPPLSEEHMRLMKDGSSIMLKMVDVNAILGGETGGRDLQLAAALRARRTVGVLHTNDKQYIDRTIDKYIDDITNHTKTF